MNVIESADPFREPTPLYEDIWNWDIVLVHGQVKIIGNAATCLWRDMPHPNCDCADKPRLTSPVLDRFGRPLEEAPYRGEPLTGEARHLLDAGPDTEISVQSGKTYRLRGPRMRHDGFAPPFDGFAAGSIWLVYAEADAIETPQPSLWQRLRAWLGTND